MTTAIRVFLLLTWDILSQREGSERKWCYVYNKKDKLIEQNPNGKELKSTDKVWAWKAKFIFSVDKSKRRKESETFF